MRIDRVHTAFLAQPRRTSTLRLRMSRDCHARAVLLYSEKWQFHQR